MKHVCRKVALVSQDVSGFDFAGHTQKIAEMCDEHGCDTILYSLFSLHLGAGAWTTTRDMIFGASKRLKTIILEAGDLSAGKTRLEVWHRGEEKPQVHHRLFAKSSDSDEQKQQLALKFKERRIGNAALLICGELNIVKTIRGHKSKVIDEYGIMKQLEEYGTRVIFGPAHTAFKRFELPIKKKALSANGRYFVSVWCKDKYLGREPEKPWQVFYDGQDVTEQVQEIKQPIPSREDIRIGVVTLK
ncbi:hypothetical protein [Bdellovibrio sp.]|uniref:hypothetical protein n=1 Tax=Bdellovibrio sp. TaxID=28201 RepID=UPI003222141F